ncbi:MAG: response regulator transcription factor [Caldilineaceae bacterium]|nr:response regulator transcription factor [Caldilineaceae bacterium]HRJ41185.1 response regulator transcription factor [Caldilineaceae bacterium]
MIRGLVVDDHAVVRKGMVQILSDLGLTSEVSVDEASTGVEMLRIVRERPYDFMLLDIALPDMNGLEALKQLRTFQPELPVLVLSIYSEKQYALRALQAGASGYLTKESAPEELLVAVRHALQGQRYISRGVADALTEGLLRGTPEPTHESLSDREFEVLCILGQGRTISQIAEHLSLSPKTVSTYRRRILTKLELTTTAELIQYAVRNDLVK